MAWKFFSTSGTQKTSQTVNAPAGAVMDFAGAAAPSGWLICDGQEVSQTTYADLFAVIGTTYNTGGETAGFFRVPDAKGRAVVGPDAGAGRVTTNNTLAATAGAENHTLTTAQMPVHGHSGTTGSNSANHTHVVNVAWDRRTDDAYTGTGNGVTGLNSGGALITGYTSNTQSANHTHAITVGNAGSGSSHNNMQPYLVLNKIIKY